MSRREELEMRKRHGDILTNIINEQRQMSTKLVAKTATRRDELMMRKQHGDLMQQIINEQRAFKQRQGQPQAATVGPTPGSVPIATSIPAATAIQIPVKNFDREITQLQQDVDRTSDEGALNGLLTRAKGLLGQVTDEYKRLTLQLKQDIDKGVPIPVNQNDIIRKIMDDQDTPQEVKDALKGKGLAGGGLAKSFFDEIIGY